MGIKDWFKGKGGDEDMAKKQGAQGKQTTQAIQTADPTKARDICEGKREPDAKGETKVETTTFTLDDIKDMPVAITVYPGCIEGDRVTYSLRGNDRVVLAYGTALQIADYSVGKEVTIKGDAVPNQLQGAYKREISRKEKEAIERIVDEMLGTGEVATTARRAQDGRYGGFTLVVNGHKVTKDSVLNSYFKELTFVMQGTVVAKATKDAAKEDTAYETDYKTLRAGSKKDSKNLAVLVGADGKPVCKPLDELTKDDKPYQVNGQTVTLQDLEKERVRLYMAKNAVSKPSKDVTPTDEVVKKDNKPVVAMGGVELVVSAIIIPGMVGYTPAMAARSSQIYNK